VREQSLVTDDRYINFLTGDHNDGSLALWRNLAVCHAPRGSAADADLYRCLYAQLRQIAFQIIDG
jgi:hypothetical protein